MNETPQRRDDARLAEQAAEWLDRLECDDSQAAPFAKWLTESRRNVEAFLFATAVEKELDGMDAARSIDVERLLARAGKNVVTLDATLQSAAAGEVGSRAPRSSPRLHRRWKWAAAAAVAVLGANAWWMSAGPGSWRSFETGVGEQRAVRLDDGSLLQLNTDSQIRVRFTGRRRDLELIYGEALFDVEHEPSRPFRVQAGGTVVQAIGTRFNVHHRTGATKVAVLEGLVEITPSPDDTGAAAQGGADGKSTRLPAGQGARLGPTGRVITLERVDAAQATAWRQRRLIFEKDTLADITDEFNRYNVAPRLVVEGEAARAKRYTGIFDADDPSSLLQYLARDGSLVVEKREGSLVIRAASR
jgi:transmembrane sensor